MNGLDRILMRILPYFVITGSDGSPYLARYSLLKLPFFRILLHHILRSDEDPDLHDHPWSFVSIILWKGYVEERATGKRRIRAGEVVRHAATDAHRLDLEKPAWTLVFATGKTRAWGFHADDRWIPYREYLDRKFGVGNYTTN